MRMPPAAAVIAAMLLGLMIGDKYVPDTRLEMKAYRKLSDAAFRRMLEEAKTIAWARGGGLEVRSMADGEGFFELRAHGQPVMLVDNSSMQLLVVVFGEVREPVLDLSELEQP